MRQAVPPVAKRLFFIDFGGIDAGNLEATFLAVEVDFYKAGFDVVNRFVVDGLGGQLPRQGGLEKDTTVISCAVSDALQIELEIGPFEEKVDVFQIGLHILIDGGFAVYVKVVFDLDFVVDKDFAPTLGEDNLLFQCGGGAVAQEVHRFFQIRNHGLDFVFIFGDFVFRQLLRLTTKGKTEQ